MVSSRQSHTWTETELRTFRSLSAQVAGAVENARLFQRAQVRAERERLVAEITDQVRTSTEVDTILRTAIGDRKAGADARPPFLLVTRETIQLNRASDCRIDVAAFGERAVESAPAAHHLEEAIALYRGPFLEGFSGGDSPSFDNWALGVRERLAHQLSTALQALARQREKYASHNSPWRSRYMAGARLGPIGSMASGCGGDQVRPSGLV